MSDAPWDGGLQPERTALAWVRTGLALTVVSLLLTRLTSWSGMAALAAGLTGLIVGAVMVLSQPARYRRNNDLLGAGTFRPALLAAFTATASTVILAGVALILVVAGP